MRKWWKRIVKIAVHYRRASQPPGKKNKAYKKNLPPPPISINMTKLDIEITVNVIEIDEINEIA